MYSLLLKQLKESNGSIAKLLKGLSLEPDDSPARMELDFLMDIVQRHVTVLVYRDSVTLTYPDGQQLKLLRDGKNIKADNGVVVYDCVIEEVRGVTAVIAEGEVLCILPSFYMEVN